MENNLQSNTVSEEEIDLVELVQKIFKEWKLILKICGITILVALVVAFSIPKEYTTEVRLAPEITDASAKGSLGGLAAMAGINLSSSSGGDAFSPDLYPDIVKSTPFLLELFSIQIKGKKIEQRCTLFDYMAEYQKVTWWKCIIKAPFDLLNWIKNFFNSESESLSSDSGSSIYLLNKEEDKIIKILQEKISVHVDKKTNMITVAITMQDPIISAQVTQVVLDNLQEYIISYRTQKARQDLEFTEKVYEEAQQRYFTIQREYAEFEDSNKHISTAKYRTEQEKLRNEMNLTYSVYNSLAQKLEQDRLRVQEQTPVFAIIEPAKVPLIPSAPKKILILIGFIFLAGVGTVGYILFRDSIQSVFRE